MSNNNKVKGLLKGLRFISQMFDEKDSDIQIGHPTDVKHLAHIGWDGQGLSDNNPSWMNEFKSVPGNSSASHSRKGDIKESNSSIQRASEDSMERSSRSVKGDERHSFESAKCKQHSNSTGNVRESQAKEKSDRPRRSKKSSKSSHHSHESCQASKDTDHDMHTGDNSHQQEDSDLAAPRKSRPKMSKDGSNVGGASSKGRSKCEGHGRRSSKLANKHESLQEDGHVETTKSTEDTGKSNLNGQ